MRTIAAALVVFLLTAMKKLPGWSLTILAVTICLGFVRSVRAASHIDVTVQINWDDGTPFPGTVMLFNPEGRGDSWTVDDTGWVRIGVSNVDATKIYRLVLEDDRGTIILDEKSVPLKDPAEADTILSIISGKQITITISRDDNSVEDVHLEAQ